MSIGHRFRQCVDLLEILAQPEGRGYLRFAGRPSFAAYKICRGLRLHCAELATFVDVGANRGQFAIASRYFFPVAELYAFEPIPSHADMLRKKLGGSAGCHVESKAVGVRCGTAEFNVSEYDHLSSLRQPTKRRLEESPEACMKSIIRVDVVSLDAWFENRSIRRPSILKLDVQGFESEVLAGGARFLNDVDYLLYESSFERMYEGEKDFSEMFEQVRSLGFELVAPLEFWRGPSGRLCEVDLLWRKVAR